MSTNDDDRPDRRHETSGLDTDRLGGEQILGSEGGGGWSGGGSAMAPPHDTSPGEDTPLDDDVVDETRDEDDELGAGRNDVERMKPEGERDTA